MKAATLPSGWAWTTLGEVCYDPQYGWTTGASEEGDLHLLRTTDITPGRVDWRSVPYCTEVPPEPERYLLNDGDIVISRAGSVGFSFLVTKPERSVFASYLIRFRPMVENRFVACFLQSPDYWKAIAEKSLGIALQNVNATKLRQIPLPLPPLAEQRRTVAKIEELFSKLDAGVEELKKARVQLRRYRQSVLKAAFEGRLTSDWRQKRLATSKRPLETPQELLERIGEERKRLATSEGRKWKEPPPLDTSELPELPEGWTWATVAQIGVVQLGRQRSPAKARGLFPTRYIRAANITEQGLDLTDVLEMDFTPDERPVFELHPGDVLLSEASGSAAQVGKPAVWTAQDGVYCFQNTVIRVRPILVRSRYIETLFKNYYLNGVFARVASGVGINHLSAGKLSTLVIPIAAPGEQDVIVSEVEERLSVIDAEEKAIDAGLAQATRLRQAILKRAFEGRLVPQDPTDEPATELLRRIKEQRLATGHERLVRRERRLVTSDRQRNRRRHPRSTD